MKTHSDTMQDTHPTSAATDLTVSCSITIAYKSVLSAKVCIHAVQPLHYG